MSTDTCNPCDDRNMVAVSNPSVLDDSLVDLPNRLLLHAYGAGNEDYNAWDRLSRTDYTQKKQDDSQFLYDSISIALGIDRKELKERTEVDLVGSPITHQRFLNRYKGSYGAKWKDVLPNGVTPIKGLYLAGDSVFPGVGVPAVALSGASAANSIMNVVDHLLATL